MTIQLPTSFNAIHALVLAYSNMKKCGTSLNVSKTKKKTENKRKKNCKPKVNNN